MGSSHYGIFILGFAIFNFATLVSDLGLRGGVLRESASASGRGDSDRARGTIFVGGLIVLGTSILGMGIVLALNDRLALFFDVQELLWLLPIIAVALPFANVGGIAMSGLQAMRKMVPFTVIQHVIDPAIRIAAFLGFVLFASPLLAAGASHLAASMLIAGVAFFWLLSSSTPFACSLLTRVQPGALLAFSFPLLLSNAVGFLLQWSDTLLLGYYLTVKDIGVYGAASRLAGLGGVFLTAVSTIFAPKIHALHGQGNWGEVGRLYQQSTRWVLMGVLPVFFYTVLNAEPLLSLFGSEFVDGAPALITLAIAFLVMTGTGPAGEVVLMTGRSKAMLYAAAASGIVGFALNVYLIPRIGLLGAAIGSGIGFALGNLANVVMAWWFTRLQPYTKALTRPVLIAMVFAGIHVTLGPVFGPDVLARLIGGVVIWLLYLIVLCSVGLDTEDIRVWRSLRESA